jgi:hypothetical protein
MYLVISFSSMVVQVWLPVSSAVRQWWQHCFMLYYMFQLRPTKHSVDSSKRVLNSYLTTDSGSMNRRRQFSLKICIASDVNSLFIPQYTNWQVYKGNEPSEIISWPLLFHIHMHQLSIWILYWKPTQD